MRKLLLIFAVFISCISCKKVDPVIPNDGQFSAVIPVEKTVSSQNTQVYWSVGDKVVLSNGKEVLSFVDGELVTSGNAECFTVTSEMISADGLTISFKPTITSSKKYYFLSAKSFSGITGMGKDGAVAFGDAAVGSEPNYVAWGESSDGRFDLKGLNKVFSIDLCDRRVKYFDVTVGYSSFELNVETVPVRYYFSIPADEDLSDGIYADAYDLSCEKILCEHYSDVPFRSFQIIDLGAFLDFGSADGNIIRQILENNQTVEATYNLEGDLLKRYLDEVQYDDDYSYTKIKNYITKGNEPAAIKPAYISIKGLKNAKKVYLVSDDYDIQTRTLSSSENQAIYSLIPGRVYKYGIVSVNAETGKETLLKKGCIATEGRVRVIKTSCMHNVRDVGGWEGLDGKHIKYGILIRGGEVIDSDDNLDQYEPYDYEAMMNHAKVNFDMDFRTDEGAGYFKKSPLGIEFIRIPLSAYDSIVLKADRQVAFKKAILKFIKNTKAGKCTYVHCQGGADRTGTFIFYIEGLLGVSDSDLCKDYEITSFYYHKERNDPERYLPMIRALQSKYKDAGSIGEAIYLSALDMGITQDDIQELRSLMLE